MPTETYPIWTIHSHHRRGAASPRYRNRAKITVFMCQQKPFPVRFSCPRKSYDPYDSVSIDLVTESVGTTDLQASFLSLVNEAGGQQIVTCIVLSLFLNDMVTIFYPQFYHSSTVFSKPNQRQMKLTRGTNFRSTIFTAVLHSNIPRTYFYFGNKGSWNSGNCDICLKPLLLNIGEGAKP